TDQVTMSATGADTEKSVTTTSTLCSGRPAPVPSVRYTSVVDLPISGSITAAGPPGAVSSYMPSILTAPSVRSPAYTWASVPNVVTSWLSAERENSMLLEYADRSLPSSSISLTRP